MSALSPDSIGTGSVGAGAIGAGAIGAGATGAVRTGARQWRGVIEEYRAWLPVDPTTPVVTLGEGGTPLVESGWLSELTGASVWLKVEGDNPTGSFKDRGMTLAISVALAEGAQAVVCASTGNTSASMTAYAARARLRPVVLVPHGRIAAGKMAQAVMHGATVVQVRGNFDDCLRLARELADTYPVSLVNSVNRVRLEGQKTAAFEVVDALAATPDVHVLPVGNAGNISAYWRGYSAYHEAGLADRLPAMWGFQAEGAAPLVTGSPVAHPDTLATAIRVGNPASWQLAEQARDESTGLIHAVSDDQILQAQRDLAARDGVFVEPASAAGAAGLVTLAARGRTLAGARVVVTVTGHGLKDVDTALAGRGPVVDDVIDADVHAAAGAAGLA
jgi:threonine synthase